MLKVGLKEERKAAGGTYSGRGSVREFRDSTGTSGERQAALRGLQLQPHLFLGQTRPTCHSPQTLSFGLQRCGNTSRCKGEALAGEGMDVLEQLDFLHR